MVWRSSVCLAVCPVGILTVTHQGQHATRPAYISALQSLGLWISSSSAFLTYAVGLYDLVCNSSDHLHLQQFPTRTNFGSRAFSSATPSVWNSSYPVRTSPTLCSFKWALKTISCLPFSRNSIIAAYTCASDSTLDTGALQICFCIVFVILVTIYSNKYGKYNRSFRDVDAGMDVNGCLLEKTIFWWHCSN